MPVQITDPVAPQPAPGQPPSRAELTPELIKQVSDRVYAMLLADLRLEFERQRRPASGARGGR